MKRSVSTSFQPVSRKEELALLMEQSSLVPLKKYLRRLIDVVVRKTEISLQDSRSINRNLLADVPALVKKYLQAERHYKFSTYFSWHIRHRLKETARRR